MCQPEYGSYRSKWIVPFYRGRAALFRGGVRVYGASCRGTLRWNPQIDVQDLPAKGVVRIHLNTGAASSPALLLLGLSKDSWANIALPLALDPFGFRGCKLYTSIGVAVPAYTDLREQAFVDLPLRLSSKGKRTLHGQWLSLGTGNKAPGALSGGLVWRFQ